MQINTKYMLIKLIFIAVFVFILISLGLALFNLAKNKNPEHSVKTFKALRIRIGLSLVLFILMFIAYTTGLIKPEGIGARIEMMKQQQIQNQNQIKP